jgi:hypothetical protein
MWISGCGRSRYGTQGREGPGDDAAGNAGGTVASAPGTGEGATRCGFGGRTGRGLAAGRAGGQISERATGVGLAICVSGPVVAGRPAFRETAAPSHGREGVAAGGQEGGAGGRDRKAGVAAHVPAQFRDACAGSGLRHSHRTGIAGPQGCKHHHDLHPCPESGRKRRGESLGPYLS